MIAVNFSNWLRTFSLANKLFLENDIEHVFIKLLLNPFHMRDVDVLISNISEEKRALELLKKKGFRPYRAGKLLHPWKIICDGQDINHLCIDIYPDAEWNRTKVGDGEEMMSRRVFSDVKGLKAYLPSPEDSFYLIATHAYFQHLTITRAEVLNLISLSTTFNFSWRKIYTLAKEYKTLDSIYAFLRAMNLEKPNTVDEGILTMFSAGGAGKFVERWFRGIKKPNFPLYVPRWLGCLIPSFAHTSALIGKIKAGELAYDFISHYMRIVGERGGLEEEGPDNT